ncbi:MAG: type II toxin-antitoxin system HicA family toxin [Verrucomicrobiota bacterium]|nr:type II toxin-antitoxin system HicA family toxin [Verrucomicrobiota bacterium]MDG1892347.1 type II toxin-antitoxin system HicA family toxin [Verrucomicrobiota bacterium]
MARFERIIQRILSGVSDRNFEFSEICAVLERLGFSCRINGSHHIFFREGIEEIINLQPKGGKAKAYQVKQVRNIIVNYGLSSDHEE